MGDIAPLSRQGLVGWVNDTLELNIVKLDELGNGAAYCQFMDLVYGDMPMAKVKFDARNEYESLQNYKILQASFTKHKVDHPFDASRLAKCRLQDNLDFTQWIYRFVSTKGSIPDYDPSSRRKATTALNVAGGGGASLSGSQQRAGSRNSIAGTNGRATSAQSRRQTRSVSNSSSGSRQSEVSTSRQSSVSRQTFGRITSGSAAAANTQKVAELTAQVEEYSHNLDVATTERTLYYGKLLEIEDLVQNELDRIYEVDSEAGMSESPHMLLLRNIQAVLYARAEGFETPYRPEDEPF